MVNIKAEPKPEVRWFLDDNELKSGGAVTIEGDGTYSRLTVTKTSSKDAGKYKVTAENSIGSDSAEFAVAVTGKVWFLYMLVLLHVQTYMFAYVVFLLAIIDNAQLF